MNSIGIVKLDEVTQMCGIWHSYMSKAAGPVFSEIILNLFHTSVGSKGTPSPSPTKGREERTIVSAAKCPSSPALRTQHSAGRINAVTWIQRRRSEVQSHGLLSQYRNQKLGQVDSIFKNLPITGDLHGSNSSQSFGVSSAVSCVCILGE